MSLRVPDSLETVMSKPSRKASPRGRGKKDKIKLLDSDDDKKPQGTEQATQSKEDLAPKGGLPKLKKSVTFINDKSTALKKEEKGKYKALFSCLKFLCFLVYGQGDMVAIYIEGVDL